MPVMYRFVAQDRYGRYVRVVEARVVSGIVRARTLDRDSTHVKM
jgi:hypothetical protein